MPENTLLSMSSAARAGAEYVEFDVAVSEWRCGAVAALREGSKHGSRGVGPMQ
jgi:hypothetical protein